MTKKQKAELALLEKLQKDHGYTWRETPKGQRTVMMFFRDPIRVIPYRVLQVVVPTDTWLAVAYDTYQEKKREQPHESKKKGPQADRERPTVRESQSRRGVQQHSRRQRAAKVEADNVQTRAKKGKGK